MSLKAAGSLAGSYSPVASRSDGATSSTLPSLAGVALTSVKCRANLLAERFADLLGDVLGERRQRSDHH